MTTEQAIKKIQKFGFKIVDCKNGEYNVTYSDGISAMCVWGSIMQVYKECKRFHQEHFHQSFLPVYGWLYF